MQTQGSLSDGGLGALLETMQAERATGTLALQNGSDSCSLYFLFGHLFHASAPTGQGEEVVVDALNWHDGTFHFDPRAKLPAEETIKSSPAELIAAAESREAVGAAGALPGDSSYFASIVETAPEHREAAFEAYLPPSAAPAPAATVPQTEAEAGADSGLASWAATQEAVEAPLPEPLAYPTPVPDSDQPAVEPAAEAEPEPATEPVAATDAAAPAAPYAVVQGPFGAAEAGGAAVYFQLPSGRSHYEGLKSAFVDFPRLLRTLRSDRHTGYVRLTGTGSSYGGFILLQDGEALEALCSNTTVTQGEAAFLHFRRHMDNGDGLLDVVELDKEVVEALGRLYAGPPLFVGLLGRFVNFDNLLEYLQEEKLDGSIIVTAGQNRGVVLLSGGDVLGAYTEADRTLDTATEPAAVLARDKASRIEVKGAPAQMTPLDVEGALNLPY